MKSVILLYNTCCIYEIATLNYFLNFAREDVIFVALDGQKVTSMEGYTMEVNMKLSEVNMSETKILIVPGGKIAAIDVPEVWDVLQKLKHEGKYIAGICAGVDVLDHSGILKGIVSTHSDDSDIAVSDTVITARANAYVDFAIEVVKKLNLFQNEADLAETMAFWKEHRRIQ